MTQLAGVGDAYHGGFVYGLVHEWSVHECVRFALAVAALNCKVLGGRTALPHLDAVKIFLLCVVHSTFPYLFEKDDVMADQLFPFRDSGGLWGFRDDTGKTVISAQYDSAGSFAEGFARVKMAGKWGFVNTLGEMVIAPQFDQARFFQGGHAKVQQGATWGYIDVRGVFVEKLEAGSFIDKTGEFISEKAYQDWGKKISRKK